MDDVLDEVVPILVQNKIQDLQKQGKDYIEEEIVVLKKEKLVKEKIKIPVEMVQYVLGKSYRATVAVLLYKQ
eukprot:Pgem_evm1s11766